MMSAALRARASRCAAIPAGALLVLTGLVACRPPEDAYAPAVRDSLGVEIVEHPPPPGGLPWEWRVSAEPVLSIGAADGAEEYLLYDVVAARRVGANRIAVALGFANQVRFFDLDGSYMGSAGAEGSGPGEFQTIMGLWGMRGDSLGVFDFGNARLTVLTAEGQLGRVYRFEQVPGRPLPLPVSPFSDGTFLGRSHMLGTEEDRPEGIHRGRMMFVRWSPTGELVDTLAVCPDGERYYGRIGNRPTMASPPFSREFAVTAAKDHWYYGSMSGYEVEMRSKTGDLVRLIRRTGPLRPVTPEMREAWQRSAKDRWRMLPAPALAWRLALPFPETLPAHGDLVVDDLGDLWVAEYTPPSEPCAWSVYAPDGSLLARVTTPPHGTVTHVGADYVLGVWIDDLDVEQVRMYRLTRAR